MFVVFEIKPRSISIVRRPASSLHPTFGSCRNIDETLTESRSNSQLTLVRDATLMPILSPTALVPLLKKHLSGVRHKRPLT